MSIKQTQAILNDATPIDFQHLITACGRVLFSIALLLEFPCFFLSCISYFLHSRHNKISNRISGIKLRLGVLLPDHAQFSGKNEWRKTTCIYMLSREGGSLSNNTNHITHVQSGNRFLYANCILIGNSTLTTWTKGKIELKWFLYLRKRTNENRFKSIHSPKIP